MYRQCCWRELPAEPLSLSLDCCRQIQAVEARLETSCTIKLEPFQQHFLISKILSDWQNNCVRMSTERKTPGKVSMTMCLLCGKEEVRVADLEKHLRDWHRVSTTDEALISSVLNLVSSTRKSHCATSATSLKGPFREISNRLADKGGTLPARMSSAQNAKSDNNCLLVDKENQEKEGKPSSIPPLPKTRSGSGSPGGQAKPNRRRSLTDFVQKSPGRVRLKGSPVHQAKLPSEKRSSWMDYIQSPGTIRALECSRHEPQKEETILESQLQKMNTIPNMDVAVQKVDREINIDSPSTSFEVDETRKMDEEDEEERRKEEGEEEQEVEQEVEDEKVKALIAQRR